MSRLVVSTVILRSKFARFYSAWLVRKARPSSVPSTSLARRHMLAAIGLSFWRMATWFTKELPIRLLPTSTWLTSARLPIAILVTSSCARWLSHTLRTTLTLKRFRTTWTSTIGKCSPLFKLRCKKRNSASLTFPRVAALSDLSARN